MKIAIVDDVQEEIDRLLGMIEQYTRENDLAYSCTSFTTGEAFLKGFCDNGFDIVFLDIFLKDENGMDVAKKIRESGKDCLIIFSSTTDEYAVRSFRLRAFDYLVKPYDYSRMSEVLSYCEKAIVRDDKYFVVKSKRQNVKILYRDVVY
ncbi:MAG: response regulator, partial [Oscillospiraceae bacterium]